MPLQLTITINLQSYKMVFPTLVSTCHLSFCFFFYCFIMPSTSFSICRITLWFMNIKFPCGKNLSKITAIRSGFKQASVGIDNKPTCCCRNRIKVFRTDSANIRFSVFSHIKVKHVYPAPSHTAIFSVVKGLSFSKRVNPNSNSGKVSSLWILCISSSTERLRTALLNWYSECTCNVHNMWHYYKSSMVL